MLALLHGLARPVLFAGRAGPDHGRAGTVVGQLDAQTVDEPADTVEASHVWAQLRDGETEKKKTHTHHQTTDRKVNEVTHRWVSGPQSITMSKAAGCSKLSRCDHGD